MSKGIWITWNSSQRSRNLSKIFNVKLYEFEIDRFFIVRFIISSIWTILILLKTKPKNIYIQYSFLLLIIVDLYKFLLSTKTQIICDCHTKALKRKIDGTLGKIFIYIKSVSFRFVNLSIISNHGLNQEISKYTKYFFVLPDPIPEINTIKLLKDTNYSIFVCSYASDEPLKEVIKAAEILIGFTLIICTGKIPKNLLYIKNEKFKNIRFTDYLSYNVYVDLITNARCIIALTKEDDCLQCGGYEGLAVGVPIVVSDTTALREYFLDSVVYVENEAKKIAEGIIYAINNKEKLSINMEKIKNKRKNEFKKQISQLKKSTSIIH